MVTDPELLVSGEPPVQVTPEVPLNELIVRVEPEKVCSSRKALPVSQVIQVPSAATSTPV
jgi:hypothetical protein